LLQKLPEEEQEYYAKEVYKNGFSLELLKNVEEGKTIQIPTSRPALPSTATQKEESTENLPSLIKRIESSTVIVFTYNEKGDFLKLGSGFFINQNGDVITNYHVIEGSSYAEVKTSDGKIYPITYIVAENEQSDIIRLSVDIPSRYIYPLSLNTTIPEVGERIIVYGSPLGLEKTVSDGIVSAVREIFDYGKIIQITAPISPGSSGSPVLNMKGEVIGIATFQMVEGQNLNFAIPSEKIVKVNENAASYFFDKSLGFMLEKEYEKALYFLDLMIEKGPLDSLSYWMIGYCNQELGVYNKAIEAYKQALRIDPDKFHAHYGLGLTYIKAGDINSALNEYKILKEIDIDKANELFDIIYYYKVSLNKTLKYKIEYKM